jgi:hypothetical protein
MIIKEKDVGVMHYVARKRIVLTAALRHYGTYSSGRMMGKFS